MSKISTAQIVFNISNLREHIFDYIYSPNVAAVTGRISVFEYRKNDINFTNLNLDSSDTFLTIAIMLPFLNFSYHNIYPNFGFGIIILTIIVKLLLYPLTKQQFESMKRMQEMMPTFKKIREKHKDNPQKLQQETMKIYKEHKINPLGGCLPMLIQLPFLFALFYTMNSENFATLISSGNI